PANCRGGWVSRESQTSAALRARLRLAANRKRIALRAHANSRPGKVGPAIPHIRPPRNIPAREFGLELAVSPGVPGSYSQFAPPPMIALPTLALIGAFL